MEDRWFDAGVFALRESATMVGSSKHEVIGDCSPPGDLTGGYVRMMSREHAVTFGLAASRAGCQRMVETLIDMQSDLPQDVLNDGLGELANVLCGNVKSLLIATDPGVTVGLPMFIRGEIQASSSARVRAVEVKFGELQAYLIFMCEPLPHDLVEQLRAEEAFAERKKLLAQIPETLGSLEEDASFVQGSLAGIFRMLDEYAKLLSEAESAGIAGDLIESIDKLNRICSIPSLKKRIPETMEQSLQNLKKIGQLAAGNR